MKSKLVFALAALGLTSGCATYYEDLMTTDQLIAASCSELNTEIAKIDSNIAASNEGSGIGIFGALAMAAAEGYAGQTNMGGAGSASGAMADQAGASGQLAADYTKKKQLIAQLKAKKGCP